MADQCPSALLHVGTYAEAGGGGLYPVTVAADGALECAEPLTVAANASFAARAAERVFIVDEMDGSVGAFTWSDGSWRLEHRFASEGDQPCYLAVAPAERLLVAANYGSGSVALWQLDGRGLPTGAPRVVRSSGTGPVKDRQEGPHCHCTVFTPDGSSLFVTDLGADAVRAIPLAESDDGLQTVFRAPPGTGPRHLLFAAENTAVLISELGSLLTTLRAGGRVWRPIASRSTLPAGFSGESLGGHLGLNGTRQRIYVSNRGHDSLAVFALDAHGSIGLLQHVASGGSSPRHFVLLEDLALLVVAHEKDGVVASFRIAPDGRLSATGHSIIVPGSCFVLDPA